MAVNVLDASDLKNSLQCVTFIRVVFADVRWNKKKGMWKVAQQKEEEEDAVHLIEAIDLKGSDSEVSASRIREKLTLYEDTFVAFPHAALLQM